jgi:D-alanyl-D-alanine carboxypeptidase
MSDQWRTADRRRSVRTLAGARRRPSVRAGVAAVVVAASVATAAAASAPTPTTAQRTADRLHEAGAPAAVVLFREGTSVSIGTAGVITLPNGRPVAGDDRFRIGSITKTFVATVVLQLVGERRLSLEDAVEKWAPGVVPGGRKITIRQLLQHTSGIADYLNSPLGSRKILAQLRRNRAYVWSPRRLVALAVAQRPTFAPGKGWAYSNTGYLLLGMIVKSVTGKTIETEVTSRIIRPLGLAHTDMPVTPRIRGAHAAGYLFPGNTAIPTRKSLDISYVSPSFAGAAGSMISTVGDLDEFYRSLLGGKLLGPAQLRAMKRTVPVGSSAKAVRFGLGIYELQTPCGPVWGHNGAILGYHAVAYVNATGTRTYAATASRSEFPADALAATQRAHDRGTRAVSCAQSRPPNPSRTGDRSRAVSR